MPCLLYLIIIAYDFIKLEASRCPRFLLQEELNVSRFVKHPTWADERLACVKETAPHRGEENVILKAEKRKHVFLCVSQHILVYPSTTLTSYCSGIIS